MKKMVYTKLFTYIHSFYFSYIYLIIDEKGHALLTKPAENLYSGLMYQENSLLALLQPISAGELPEVITSL